MNIQHSIFDIQHSNCKSQTPLPNETVWGLDDSDMPDIEPVEWCELCGEAVPVCRCGEKHDED